MGKRKKKRQNKPDLPDVLEIGQEISCEEQEYRVVEGLDPLGVARCYRVTLLPDAEEEMKLFHCIVSPDQPGLDPILNCLEKIHSKQRVVQLPVVVAHEVQEDAEYLVLDQIDGSNLEDVWSELADPHELSLCFEQIFLCVSKVHRAGYVVGNLKPSSFCQDDDGGLQLVDLSTLTERGFRPDWIEESPYLDPNLSFDSPVFEQSDIYSVGAIFLAAYRCELLNEGADILKLVDEVGDHTPVVTQLLQASLNADEARFVAIDEMRVLLYQLKNEQSCFPRPTAAVSSTVGVSRHRYINEDSAGFQEIAVQYQSRPQYIGCFCVADGMGGHELGERASQLAVLGALQAFRQLVQDVPFDRLVSDLPNYALQIGRIASEVVSSGASQFAGGAHMGTTFTGVLVVNDTLAMTHVGDSRGILVRDGRLTHLTLDHSLVASLVRAGQMTEEEAAKSDERNVLVRCIDARMPLDEGGFDGLHAIGHSDGRLRMCSGDRIVLMSDGVWGVLSDEDITDVVRSAAAPQKIADRMVEAAISNGSDDNATVMVLCWV